MSHCTAFTAVTSFGSNIGFQKERSSFLPRGLPFLLPSIILTYCRWWRIFPLAVFTAGHPKSLACWFPRPPPPMTLRFRAQWLPYPISHSLFFSSSAFTTAAKINYLPLKDGGVCGAAGCKKTVASRLLRQRQESAGCPSPISGNIDCGREAVPAPPKCDRKLRTRGTVTLHHAPATTTTIESVEKQT